MFKHFLKSEIRQMIYFHGRVLMGILKTLGYAFRYGVWFLPWIFLMVLIGKPLVSGFRAFISRNDPVLKTDHYTPSAAQAPSEKGGASESFQNRMDSAVRIYEKISRQIRKK